MFWTKRYKTNSGEVWTQRPGQINVTFANTSQAAQIQFKFEMPFTLFYLRTGPASGSLNIYGDEFGPRLYVNEINAVGLFQVSQLVGSPTINAVSNTFSLDLTP